MAEAPIITITQGMFTGLTIAELTVMRTEALASLRALMSGSKMASVTYGDRSVTYRNYVSDLDNLRLYIAALNSAIDGTGRQPPFRMIF